MRKILELCIVFQRIFIGQGRIIRKDLKLIVKEERVMPKWLRKSLVVLVTVLTFGIVTPSQLHDFVNDKDPKRDAVESKTQDSATEVQQIEFFDGYTNEKDPISNLLKDAEHLSYTKFGTRIGPVIEDEFREIILPNIEKVIETVASQYEEDSLRQLYISEAPSGGDSERIFHIANRENNEDVIRFHVRRDHPPQDGYWFNFHYHIDADDFQEHHEIGSIYWAKNTPPKWMS